MKERRKTRRAVHATDQRDGLAHTIPVCHVKATTAPCQQMQVKWIILVVNTYVWQEEPRRTIQGTGALALSYMECFSSATNLFSFLRLSEVVIERGDIRMQV